MNKCFENCIIKHIFLIKDNFPLTLARFVIHLGAILASFVRQSDRQLDRCVLTF